VVWVLMLASMADCITTREADRDHFKAGAAPRYSFPV